MLEVRGINAYERFSLSDGKSRTGGNDGAEFKQLLQTGEVLSPTRVSGRKVETADEGFSIVSGPNTSMYDGSGRIALAGPLVGRSINVAI